MARPAAACLLLAALSLLGPSEPSYDPWAWLVWGREIGHLTLDTTGGPSWKPLPVAFTTLFAPLSAVDDRIPPALWIVVARAGGLLALADRLPGGRPGRGRRPASGADRRAAWRSLALALTPEWIRYIIHGNEAPLAVGLGAARARPAPGRARERRLRGRRLGLPGCGRSCSASCCIYAAYLFVRRRGAASWSSRRGVVAAAWLVPSWIGSGDPLSAVPRPAASPPGACRSRRCPGAPRSRWRRVRPGSCSSSRRWRPSRWRGRRAARPPALAAGARPARRGGRARGVRGRQRRALRAMTEAGFSGNARYVLPAVAASRCSVAWAPVCSWSGAGRRPARSPASSRRPCSLAGRRARAGDARRRRPVGGARGDRAVAAPRGARARGGPVGARYTTLFGPATVNRSYQTHLAWELSLPVSDVHGARGRGISFTLRGGRGRARADPPRAPARGARSPAWASWTVTERLPELPARVHVAGPGLQPARRRGARTPRRRAPSGSVVQRLRWATPPGRSAHLAAVDPGPPAGARRCGRRHEGEAAPVGGSRRPRRVLASDPSRDFSAAALKRA